jgi:aminopeptidase N
MVRHILGDEKFKAMLLEMQRRFRHQVVTSAQLEAFMNSYSENDLTPLFDQYLRTTQVPQLEWGVANKQLLARWTNCIDTFRMQVQITMNGKPMLTTIGRDWKVIATGKVKKAKIELDRNWYATVRAVPPSEMKGIAPVKVVSPELQ